MRIRMPRLFDSFVCLADACPDTCCAAWEIELDRESAEHYQDDPSKCALLSSDGVTLRQSESGACPHLSDCGLCRAYDERPRVCREYPLYHHDLGSNREYGLSFSCPAILPLVLAEKEPLAYDVTDDPSVYPDTYSEIDPALLPEVMQGREDCLSLASDKTRALFDRLAAILLRSRLLEAKLRGRTVKPQKEIRASQKRRKTLFARLLWICRSFEYLDPAHADLFSSALAFVRSEDLLGRLDAFSAHMSERTHEYEKWLSQSLYQSYGFAAETRDPLLRAKASVSETLILYLLGASRYAERGDFTLDDQAELFRIFSREYEHSTENPSLLRKKLRHPAFSLRKMLASL